MKKMASFITLFLLLPCIVLGILLFWGFGLPAQYEETFLGEMKYKMDRLKETASLSEASSSPAAFRRVILVGGSSIPFGFKTALATEALPDLTFVDFGMYADMGTVVMLDWLRPYVKEVQSRMPSLFPATFQARMYGRQQTAILLWQLLFFQSILKSWRLPFPVLPERNAIMHSSVLHSLRIFMPGLPLTAMAIFPIRTGMPISCLFYTTLMIPFPFPQM